MLDKEGLYALGILPESVEFQEGLSVGAVWSVYRMAKELGIEEALGKILRGSWRCGRYGEIP